MLTVKQVLELRGIDLSNAKLVRHAPAYDNITSDYRDFWRDKEAFSIYQATQGRDVFGGADYIISFGLIPRGLLAEFLGVYKLTETIENHKLTHYQTKTLRRHFENYPDTANYYYKLEEISGFDDLKHRLIIDWGISTRSWVQRKDKPIFKIEPLGYMKPFTGYDNLLLGYDELTAILENPVAHPDWYSSLSNIRAVYLIVDTVSGHQYVGSAYGAEGLWNRWLSYAKSGHGGNKLMKELGLANIDNRKNLRFSLLGYGYATDTEVLSAERVWKDKLMTREFGMNGN